MPGSLANEDGHRTVLVAIDDTESSERVVAWTMRWGGGMRHLGAVSWAASGAYKRLWRIIRRNAVREGDTVVVATCKPPRADVMPGAPAAVPE